MRNCEDLQVFHIPDIPFNSIDVLLLGLLGLALVGKLVFRFLKAEFGRHTCVLCGEAVPADEYTHHLEICGLKRLLQRQGDVG